MTARGLLATGGLILLTGCPCPAGTARTDDGQCHAPDAGPPSTDAGRDAGPADASPPDAADPDAGGPDAAGPFDAGLPDVTWFFDGGPDCPIAVLAPVPQNTDSLIALPINGSNSIAYPGSTVSEWQYRMEPPRPLNVPFSPAGAPLTSYTTSIAGLYTVSLDVVDDQGRTSCTSTSRSFTVTPSADVHVELTWTTPGDLDPFDTGPGAGSDLDLHVWNLAYPATADHTGDGQADAWFTIPGDAFWFSTAPNWDDPASPYDNPNFFLGDDTAGLGPELVVVPLAPVDNVYRLAVHYYDDSGYGPSTARLDVFTNDKFVGSLERTLVHKDFWIVYDKSAVSLTVIDTVTPNVDPPVP